MREIRLLIAEGDPNVRKLIRAYADREGFLADEAPDGITALKLFRRNTYHAVVLNTRLPELDGRNVCRQIRKTSEVPVLFVSEEIEEENVLSCFRLGADDYLRKPFSVLELMARVKVFLHRSGGQADREARIISAGDLVADTVSRVVYVDRKIVKLTPREYELLVFLMRNPDRAFSRQTLLNEVWGNDLFVTDRTVDTHIRMLRESLKPYHHHIATVWGFGYKFSP